MAERAYIVTKGVVLRETETKEADKILTLLTADRGQDLRHRPGRPAEELQVRRLRSAAGLFGVDPLSEGRVVLRQ